jgi:hypothetical protein
MKCRQMPWCIVICTNSPCEPFSRPPGPGSLLPIYCTRGATYAPRLGITICRVLYSIGKCVFYFKKTVFLGKKRKSTALAKPL